MSPSKDAAASLHLIGTPKRGPENDDDSAPRSDTRTRSPFRTHVPALLIALAFLAALSTSLRGLPRAPWHRFPATASVSADPPRNSTNLTSAVQWDAYTLFLRSQRVFLHSGELHPFRLPVPALWRDIFEKMAAAGLNAASIYVHMGLTNPAPGVLDWDAWRGLPEVFAAAQAAGLWIVLRPGPYINAETTAGGLALWTTSRTRSELRTNASDIEDSWMPYLRSVVEETAPHQISNGGVVIAVQVDNEYVQTPAPRAEYIAQLEATYKAHGVAVPLTYNDPGPRRAFLNGTGAPDIYGMDAYPLGFDCSHPDVWAPSMLDTDYRRYHVDVDPARPWYIPEWQAGSYDPWGGSGYDKCAQLTGPQFQDTFNKQTWASNAKLLNHYMFYGGTNWGGLPYPGVYTSYDYGAPLREDRSLGPKFDELKRQGLFLRSSPAFRKTDWVGDSLGGVPGVSSSSDEAFVTLLRNPDTNTQFAVLRNANAMSTEPIAFNLTIATSAGVLTLPRTLNTGIELNGRQSKVVLTDYAVGSRSSLLYSTAPVLFAGVIGSTDVVLLYGDGDQGHEFAVAAAEDKETKTYAVAHTGVKGLRVLHAPTRSAPRHPLVLFADTDTASSFFAPAIPAADPHTPYRTFWQFGTNDSVLVGRPYLVRGASVSEGGRVLALRGDLNASVPLTLVVPANVQRVSWNGADVPVRAVFGTEDVVGVRILEGELRIGVDRKDIVVPRLEGWRFHDSLPEIKPGFDDDGWVTADHTTTNISAPLFGDGRVLYGCDYGFCENTVLWRGHFTGSGAETGVNLTINGGTAFAASVWLNDVFIGSTGSSPRLEETNALYTFPAHAVRTGEDNVVTVVQDHMGNDMDPTERSPRGIRGFALTGGNITTWKVQGKLGGYTNFPDKTRGILNEGGLFAERAGWHLPGFDTSPWPSRDLSSGLPDNTAGVGFFVTTFVLDVPRGVDAAMSFVFDGGARTTGQAYRALLFVNGWQYGKRVSNIGPQAKFPVPPGILDYNGKNTVAVALWSLTNARVSPTLELILDHVVEGGVEPIAVNNPPWTPRS